MNKRTRIFGLVAAGLFLATLAACYLPNNFMSEIRIGRTGDFALMFEGELVWAPLYREIRQGKLTPEELTSKIEMIRRDLARDRGFTKLESQGDGRFLVKYERQGRLSASEEVTFVRRNAIILMIKSSPDGRVTINGNNLRPSDAQTATNLGIGIKGEFRIVTDGLVKENNAGSIKPFGAYRVYIWKIENAFSPAPHFVMQREGVWPQPKEK